MKLVISKYTDKQLEDIYWNIYRKRSSKSKNAVRLYKEYSPTCKLANEQLEDIYWNIWRRRFSEPMNAVRFYRHITEEHSPTCDFAQSYKMPCSCGIDEYDDHDED